MNADRRGPVVVAIAGFAAIAVLRAVLALGFPGDYDPDRFQTLPDATSDVLVTEEAFDGGDPYRPIDEIARDRGVPVADLPDGAVHFRFPAAFLLQAPLLAVPAERAPSVAVVVNVLCLAAVAWWVWRWKGVPHVAFALPVVAVTPPFLELLAHGPAVGVLTLAFTWAWWAFARDRPGQAAAGIGALGVLRGFPLLLVPAAFLAGRRRAAWWATAGFLAANAIGMLVLGIGLPDVLSAGTSTTELFGPDVHNASLAGMLMRLGLGSTAASAAGLLLVVSVCWVSARRHRTLDSLLELTVPAMLLASPLSWPTYQVLYLPWAGSMLGRGATRPVSLVAAGAFVGYGIWLVGGPSASGLVGFGVNLIAFGAASSAVR